jgi:hypothetical protein
VAVGFSYREAGLRGYRTTLAALAALALGIGGCTELVDGQVSVDLIYPCRPGPGELGPRMSLFCLSVMQGETLLSGPACASSLPAARLELPEALTPAQVVVEIFDASGVLLLRGASPAVSLLSGEDLSVPVALATAQEFSLMWADETGCQPLAHPLEGHSATLFPTGHLLLAGSARAEVTAGRAALLLDTYDPAVATLSTPISLHRHQHEGVLLDDGQLLLVGGLTTQGGAPTPEVVSLAGGSELLGAYVPGLDYAGAVQLEASPGSLTFGRPRPHAAVFFGAQVWIADGESPPEMLLDAGTRSALVEFPGEPGVPFPANGRTPTVVPYSEGKALVPGLGAGRLARLTVQEGTSSVLFEVVLAALAPRDHPLALLLPGGSIMVLGGLVGAVVDESPVVVLDSAGGLTPVALPAGFPERGFSATLLGGGRVLVAGGVAPGASQANEWTYLIQPAGAGAWRVARGPDLRLARAFHTATWLPDGRLLVIGGTALGAGTDPARSVEALSIAVP